ncbi:siderophore-interacting protein [Psychromonas sp. 14N.309.X.WAT.B.A12]|jgi:NADPH-dependent ferric siderophore reductase|uniref:siderophore-interacting protein n=1 Tax=unclassified Psychromonas TaxID=2614957 RepID=UPI0025B1A8FA|nr:siderophore-interacting protein [Psychromonas sp. 14N.309.X.WAT.B.A12]MDN2663057.1 siderophore-interacting protein [Psychromonas sp. 14N.309.X.WAT.B.A12]
MRKQIRQANVLSSQQITPHLQRIVIGSEEFKGFTSSLIGNYVKVLLAKEADSTCDIEMKSAWMRSYTIQDVEEETGALTLDFVINMHQGPATDWAKTAKVGDKLAIAGPGPKKLDELSQPHYVLIGDLTSVNAIKGYLHLLPKSARIDAIIHVPNEQDIINLDTKRSVNWVVTTTPNQSLPSALDKLNISEDSIIFMAIEAGLMTELKGFFAQKYQVSRTQIVASGYWKQGVDSENYKLQRQQLTNTK